MPYKNDGSDVPENIQKLPKKKRRQWAHVWNSVFERCLSAGGEKQECESRAFAQANAVIFKEDDMSELQVNILRDKLQRARALLDEIESLFTTEPESESELKLELEPIKTEAKEEQTQEDAGDVSLLNESFDASPFNVEDIAEATPDGVLTMKVRLIRPGFGNARDNHYYSEELLKRDTRVFEGVKMYETDHRQHEKSTRTWVSTIRKIVGWDNGPIAEVVVHDPNFAQRVRNLQKAGLLDKLECSILGTARVGTPTEIDGRLAKPVLQIIEGESVDWVTKAGAGGSAVSVAESDKPVEQERVGAASEVEEASEIVFLSESAVNDILKASRLPKAAWNRIKGPFRDEAEVRAAIEAEIAYIMEVTGSGKPVTLRRAETLIRRPIAERLREVNRKYFNF